MGSIGWVRWQASGHVYAIEDVPEAPVALVLGAQVHDNGSPSGFLEARLDIARRLYEAGKVRAVLVSGDHGQWSYDEPDAMRQWLIDRGVPDRKVVADHAGFDTYDSCQRAIRVFGVRQLIVVTQSFHIDRAVALCRDAGIDATGVGDDTARRFGSFWTKAVDPRAGRLRQGHARRGHRPRPGLPRPPRDRRRGRPPQLTPPDPTTPPAPCAELLKSCGLRR